MDPLDRELAEAINVNPSPEFGARVRMRVATERAPRRRVPVLSLATVGMAIAIVLAVWTLRDHTNTQTSHGHLEVAATASSHAVQRPPDRFRVATIPAKRSVTIASRRPSVRVVVAAEDVQGLRRLSKLVRDGVVLSFPDEAQRDDSTLSPPLMDIAVAPIDITPIAIASNTEEGDAQ